MFSWVIGLQMGWLWPGGAMLVAFVMFFRFCSLCRLGCVWVGGAILAWLWAWKQKTKNNEIICWTMKKILA